MSTVAAGAVACCAGGGSRLFEGATCDSDRWKMA